MAYEFGFFDSVDGDRKYSAEDIGNFLGTLITSGVEAEGGDQLQVIALEGMKVGVNPGWGRIQPHYIHCTSMEEFEIEQGDALLDRIDAIVMKCDENISMRKMSFEYKKGEAASSPEPPKMIRGEKEKEYCLAYVKVPAKTTSITQANIVDTRPDTEVCGWIASVLQKVETSELFRQWQKAYEQYYEEMESWKSTAKTEFEEWVEELKGILSEDVAGNLAANKIDMKVSEIFLPVLERAAKTFYLSKAIEAKAEEEIKTRLEDNLGRAFYLATKEDLVYFDDGKTLAEKIIKNDEEYKLLTREGYIPDAYLVKRKLQDFGSFKKIMMTKVINTSTDSAVLFESSELKELFGLEVAWSDHFAFSVSNGDENAQKAHVQGTSWNVQKERVYVVFDRVVNGEIRINVEVTYYDEIIGKN